MDGIHSIKGSSPMPIILWELMRFMGPVKERLTRPITNPCSTIKAISYLCTSKMWNCLRKRITILGSEFTTIRQAYKPTLWKRLTYIPIIVAHLRFSQTRFTPITKSSTQPSSDHQWFSVIPLICVTARFLTFTESLVKKCALNSC